MNEKSTTIAMLFIIITLFGTAFAKGNHYPHSSYSGSTHSVKTYTKSDGTKVEKHLAGNPKSGTHCHDNVCSSN